MWRDFSLGCQGALFLCVLTCPFLGAQAETEGREPRAATSFPFVVFLFFGPSLPTTVPGLLGGGLC